MLAEFALIRCFCNFAYGSVTLFRTGTSPFDGLTREMVLPLAMRCVFGNLAFIVVVYTYKYLPLSVATVITSSSPFFVSIASYLFLKERLFKSDLIAIVVSFFGIGVMAIAKQSSSDANLTTGSHYITAIFGAVFVMLCQAVLAISGRMMKKLNYVVIQTYNGLFGCLLSVSILLYQSLVEGKSLYGYSRHGTYVWMFFSGTLDTLGQNLMVITMQRSNPAAVSLYRYCGVFYGFMYDLVVFRRSFVLLQIVGLLIVFSANIGALLYK